MLVELVSSFASILLGNHRAAFSEKHHLPDGHCVRIVRNQNINSEESPPPPPLQSSSRPPFPAQKSSEPLPNYIRMQTVLSQKGERIVYMPSMSGTEDRT